MLTRRRDTVDAVPADGRDLARSAPHTGLADARVGSPLRITAVGLAGGERLRLAAFGLRPGAVVTVLARTAGGGHLVGFGTSRIVLDHRTAGHLAVRAA